MGAGTIQPEFKDFIARWQAAALRRGAFALPTRGDITASGFSDHLPKMMIARWDFEAGDAKNLYVGSKIEAVWQRDMTNVQMQDIFPNQQARAFHVEIARAVLTKKLGAFVEAELVFDNNLALPLAQLRLPLAAEGERQIILSLFGFPEVPSNFEGRMPKLQNVRSAFIQVMPDKDIVAAD